MARAVELLERQVKLLESLNDKLSEQVDVTAAFVPPPRMTDEEREARDKAREEKAAKKAAAREEKQRLVKEQRDAKQKERDELRQKARKAALASSSESALRGSLRHFFPKTSRAISSASAGLNIGRALLGGGAAEGGVGAAGRIAGVLGPVGAVVGAFGLLAVGTVKAVEALQEFGNKMHDQNMQFAEFSATMRGVQARQRIREIQLSKERGDRRAATAEKVAEQQHRMNEATARMKDAWDEITSQLFLGMAKSLQPILDGLSKVAQNLSDALTGRDRSKEALELAMSARKEEENFYAKYGRPGRFN